MITVEVQGLAEAEAYLRFLPTELKQGSVSVVYTVAVEGKEAVRGRMPIDTSWAQARFGDPAYGGIWEVKDEGLTIEFGSDLDSSPQTNPFDPKRGMTEYEYIIKLNEGSSVQAPAGFIDAEAAKMEIKLADGLSDMINEVAR